MHLKNKLILYMANFDMIRFLKMKLYSSNITFFYFYFSFCLKRPSLDLLDVERLVLRKMMVSTYAHIHNLYMPKQVQHHIWYTNGFTSLFYTLCYVKKKMKITLYLTLMIKIQHVYLNTREFELKYSITSRVTLLHY